MPIPSRFGLKRVIFRDSSRDEPGYVQNPQMKPGEVRIEDIESGTKSTSRANSPLVPVGRVPERSNP